MVHAGQEPQLAYRTLGRTGLKVTTLSFGAMLTPSRGDTGRNRLGINYVDSACRYLNGRSESIVGRAIQGIRDKIYLATKTKPDSNTRETMVPDVETVLKSFGTDHIDVIQLHNLTYGKRAFIPEVREAYATLKAGEGEVPGGHDAYEPGGCNQRGRQQPEKFST